MEEKIPAYILAQVHPLAADGLSVDRISFLLRIDRESIEEELRNPTAKVNTTEDQASVDQEAEQASSR